MEACSGLGLDRTGYTGKNYYNGSYSGSSMVVAAAGWDVSAVLMCPMIDLGTTKKPRDNYIFKNLQ